MGVLTQSDFLGGPDYLGSTSRRVFVGGIGSVGVSLVLSTLGGCEWLEKVIRNRPIRRRIGSGSAADADVATYREAVNLMKGLPATDKRRWLAEATIHGTTAGFNMCEHGTDHFFDWHRAYLFYFEKICQRLTNKPKFGLPYWNWNQNHGVPAPYLDASSPLFSSRSRTTMGISPSVSTSTLDVIFQDTNFFSFSTQIEGAPHNSVHSWIDGTLGQYNSPLDPLFWNHHCMVDYCWYKWNIELGRQNTNDPTWINKSNGQFVDADGNAASSTAAATILMPLLAYRYESSAIGSSPAQREIRPGAEFRRLDERIRAGAAVRFVVSQRTRLAERADFTGGRPMLLPAPVRAQSFATILESSTAPERVFLAVEQANVPRSTDFYVRVFVNLPEASAGTPTDDPHFAGSFAFFGNPSEAHHGHAAAAEGGRPRFLVDLTHTLRNLRQQGALAADAPITVQLVPTPMDAGRPLEGVQMVLSGLDIITTPVVVSAGEEQKR